MDYVEDKSSSEFVSINPNNKETSGCGESFNIWLLGTTQAVSSRSAHGNSMAFGRNLVTVTYLKFKMYGCLMSNAFECKN